MREDEDEGWVGAPGRQYVVVISTEPGSDVWGEAYFGPFETRKDATEFYYFRIGAPELCVPGASPTAVRVMYQFVRAEAEEAEEDVIPPLEDCPVEDMEERPCLWCGVAVHWTDATRTLLRDRKGYPMCDGDEGRMHR